MSSQDSVQHQQSELNNILCSIENYKESITNTPQEIVSKFVDVMLGFIRLISKKLFSTKKTHYNFIVERGLDTISHVFQMSYCITKNLEVSYYCSIKAFYLYTEFIEQISDDNISFLKLSSRDATLFVYKKTIYELNNDCRKKMKQHTHQEQQILEDVNRLIHFNKTICMFALTREKMNTLQERDKCIDKCCEHIQMITHKKENYKSKNSEHICTFANILSQKDITLDEYFQSILDFLTSKTNLNNSRIKIMEQMEECEIK